jgi:excisionase family DNA binding protein
MRSLGLDANPEVRMADDPLVVSVEEAARLLGIGRGLAYDAARAGTLPGLVAKIGGRYLVSRARLLAALAPEESESA